MEISRASKFLMDRGAIFMVELVSTNYRRSPLVQGGLEIPAKITGTMPGTVRNRLLIDKYKEIVTEIYAEPKKEEILGSFLALLPEPIRKLKEQKSTPKVTTKKEKRKTQGQDIRKLFRKIAEKNEKEDDEIDLHIEKTLCWKGFQKEETPWVGYQWYEWDQGYGKDHSRRVIMDFA